MPRNKKRFGLGAKFNLLTISLILATSVGICLFVVRLEISTYYAELLNHGKTIADTTAKNCEFGVFTENQAALLAVIEGLSSNTDIAYASVLTKGGRVLAAQTFHPGEQMPASPFADIRNVTAVAHQDFVNQQNGKQYLEILYPVVGSLGGVTDSLLQGGELQQAPQIIGYLRIGLTQEGLRLRIRELLIATMLMTFVIVLFGSLLSVFLSKRFMAPLGMLKAATREIASGNFDTPLEILTRDEIAELAGSFNDMRRSLRDYHRQVAERTTALTAANDQMLQEIAARQKMEKKLQHEALHDVLTGLPNRALFLDRLSHTISISSRHKDYIYAVLFLDIDRFKVINDSLGHIVGDELLIAIGQRLLSCIRPADTVARFGGDEFSILLEDISGLGNATFIAERIESALTAPFTVAGHEVFATGSIGIALSAADYDHPEQVLRDADTAMYQAKSSSHATYAVFEPGMHIHALERLHLETDLRRAVERREFVVFYQPIVSLESNRLSGFEALVRWLHPVRGLLNPGEFLQMAEDTGIIVAIDRLVLHEACRQMQEWHQQFPLNGHEFISVNLSNKQMVQPDLVEHVAQILGSTGLDPGSLKLEITESVIIENPEKTVDMLTRLKALGVRLYIDDFGTGYSSLSYLHRLPIDGLKIDRSFIMRMGEAGENQEIVRTILLLARDMHIESVAEGVETASQLAQVKSLNCLYGQGYLFSKPVESSRAHFCIPVGLRC